MEIRQAIASDIQGMARLRSVTWGTEPFWVERITAYLAGQSDPQMALPERVAYVAAESDGSVVGLIAGHRTRRLGCSGELEWIDVYPSHRGTGLARKLLVRLAAWFVEQGSTKVCIDVAADNHRAQQFYRKNGAVNLDAHWLYWEDIGIVGAAFPES